jgi:hypothetical protein
MCVSLALQGHGTMSMEEHSADQSTTDPVGIYLEMQGNITKVLSLSLEGKTDVFRDFLVGYLMVVHHYSEGRATRLVAGNEDAILLMLTEEQENGLW